MINLLKRKEMKKQLLAQQGYNLVRLSHLMGIMITLTGVMPAGIEKSFERDYLWSRTGAVPEEHAMFDDLVDYLILGGFYRQKLEDGHLYIPDN